MAKVTKPSKVGIALETAIASFSGGPWTSDYLLARLDRGPNGMDPDHHNGTFGRAYRGVLLCHRRRPGCSSAPGQAPVAAAVEAPF